MNGSKPRFYFLTLLLTVTALLAFLVLRPFLYALILGVVFAVILQPIFRRLLGLMGERFWLASILTILLTIIFGLTPMMLIGWQIFQESQQLYYAVSDRLAGGQASLLWSGWLERFPGLNYFSFDLEQYLKTGLGYLYQNLGAIFSSLAKLVASAFVFLISLFYLLKDGDRIKRRIIAMSPLTKADDEAIIEKVVGAVNSVIKGSLTIAVIQGLISSFGFFVFGVPNPVLWGALATFGALIPGVGTAIVIAPAVVYLFFTVSVTQAAGLLVWGILAVGLIDNFLGPKLIGRGAKLHPLLTLLSVLGGLSLFGPIGFILGPLTTVFLLVLLEIYLAPLATIQK